MQDFDMEESELDADGLTDQSIPWRTWLFSPKGRLGRASFLVLIAPVTILQIWLSTIGNDGLTEGVFSFLFSRVWLSNVTWLFPWDMILMFSRGWFFGDPATNYASFARICFGLLAAVWSIKRMHDNDATPWLLLLSFVPYLGTIIFIILTMVRGENQNRNKYGLPERFRKEIPSEDEAQEEFIKSL